MKSSLLAVLVIVIGSAGQNAAAALPSACAARQPTDTDASFLTRTYDYCELHWKTLVSTKATGGQTHDASVNACARRCSGKLGPKNTGYDLNNVAIVAVPAVVVTGAAGAVAASRSSAPPASP